MSYRITNWAKSYETAETRKLKNLNWVPLPNRHDSAGYRRLMALPDGLQIYGAWTLILQVASRMPRRGLLESAGVPVTAEDLHFRTGAPALIFERALTVLSGQNIGWLEEAPDEPEPPAPADPLEPQQTAAAPAGTPSLKGREGKGTEGKDPEEQAAEGRGTVRDAMPPGAFKRFWDAYPSHKRTSGRHAEKAFEAAARRVRAALGCTLADAVQHIVDRTKEFSASPKGLGKFCPHPATFLNGARYDDDPITWQTSDTTGPGAPAPHRNRAAPGLAGASDFT
jgi:hypothetical protein